MQHTHFTVTCLNISHVEKLAGGGKLHHHLVKRQNSFEYLEILIQSCFKVLGSSSGEQVKLKITV